MQPHSGKLLKLLPPDVNFKAEMHQIVCRLGLLQRFPRPPSWILGAYF